MTDHPRKTRKKVLSPEGFSAAELALGQKIRAAYQRERSAFESIKSGKKVCWKIAKHYDGREAKTIEGEVVEDKGTPSIWGRLAVWFFHQRLDPDAYICFQFEQLCLGRAPEPPELCSAKLFAAFRCGQGDDAEIIYSLTYQLSTLLTDIRIYKNINNLSTEDATLQTLYDVLVPLSALFRYCLACSMPGDKFKKLIKFYQEDAVMQFQQHRQAYLQHWATMLPEGFAAEAERIYLNLTGR